MNLSEEMESTLENSEENHSNEMEPNIEEEEDEEDDTLSQPSTHKLNVDCLINIFNYLPIRDRITIERGKVDYKKKKNFNIYL